MKKFKTGLVALALVFGVSAAVVAKVQAMPKKLVPTYDWTGSDFLPNATVQEAKDHYGCQADNEGCASGTRVSGEPTDPLTETISEI